MDKDEALSLPTRPARRVGWQRRSWWAIAGPAAVWILALVLYTWMLSRNGMANSYYAAAVKSGTVSWKALFFGALDPGSFITVDKPPVSLWLQILFAKVFGFSSWSILLPQALAGVASVLILYRLVRDWAGEAAGLLSALALALTPVAVVMFRFNNPDALLTLLLLLAAWAVWSAMKSGSTWKLVAAGMTLGFAFLTKMMEALTVLPAFVIVYLACGPARLARRLLQLLAALVALVISGGWWIAVVELWPASSRPFIGGTQTNSIIDLVSSRSGGYIGDSTTGANLSGTPSWLRIFNVQLGGQISWLLPLAFLGLAAGLYATLRLPRRDERRAGYVLWGLWAVVMVAVFSYATGTLHSYYVVILAPAVAALAGAGSVQLWRLGRSSPWLSWLLPAGILGSALWSAALIGRVSGYAPGLATAVIVVGSLSALGLLLVLSGAARSRPLAYGAAALAVVALLAGPTAFSLSTVARTVTGNTASAGPDGGSALGESQSESASAELDVDTALLAYLQDNQGSSTFLVAVQSSSASVPLILASGEPVLTIGGYKQRDPTPTVAQFEALVASGEIRYALVSTDGSHTSGSAEASDEAQEVAAWIADHGHVIEPEEYGGETADQTLYYLQ